MNPFNVLAFVARVLEASVVVFTRVRFGERYLGGHALCVIPAVFIFVTLREEPNPDPLLGFLSVWFLAFICARADIQKRRRRGDMEHSYYNGYPVILKGRGFRRMSEQHVKLVLEPVLLLLISAFLMEVNESLGMFVLLGAFGTLVSSAMGQAQERQRLIDVRDAQLEQRSLAECFRENRWQ